MLSYPRCPSSARARGAGLKATGQKEVRGERGPGRRRVQEEREGPEGKRSQEERRSQEGGSTTLASTHSAHEEHSWGPCSLPSRENPSLKAKFCSH